MIAEFLMAAQVVTIGESVRPWPGVQPFEATFHVADPRNPFIRAAIADSAGRPLYLFVCRGAEQTERPDIVYAGTLDCRLMAAAGGEVEENLLVEDEGLSAWYSRGRMFPYELAGICAEYPEYGRVRHFSLRGMRLTLSFENATFAGADTLRQFDVRVSVVPDLSATTAIAASCGYLDPNRQVPGRSCRSVQKGVEWPRGRRTRG